MQFGEWSAAEMSNYTKVAFHVFKGSGSDKWNCLLSCFFSGVASRCHPVICSLSERKLDALQLTRFNVYFHVQCGIKMRIDFVYRVTCKQKKKQQKMNHSIWEARLSHWLIYCIIIGVKREKMKSCWVLFDCLYKTEKDAEFILDSWTQICFVSVFFPLRICFNS